MNRKKQRRLRRPSHKQVRDISKILGAVWSLPSDEAAQSAIHEIASRRYELRPGSLATSAAFYSASDDEGCCLILVGSGDMFDGGFLATCSMCVQRRGGVWLPESARTQAMIKWADGQWQKSQKQESIRARRLVAELERNKP